MAVPKIDTAFVGGEYSPKLYGRSDLARYAVGCSTLRNLFVGYQGGAYSRAGTAFVGFSKQTGRTVPPRLIPFQFSINQGLALEFGNFYMRVVANGGFVTENPFAITGITQASPATVSYATLSTAMGVTANNAAVSASYNRGDFITPAGGTHSTLAQFQVVNTTLAGLTLGSGGSGFAVNDSLTLAGGTNTVPPVLTVTGVSGGAITTFVISNGGTFTANGSGNFTQASTTGAGTGATFMGGLFGPLKLNVTNPGAYTVIPANPANQGSTSGTGSGGTYTIAWAIPSALASGDWVALAGIGGMINLNGQTVVIENVTPTTFQIFDVYGNPINTTTFPAWTAGGTASRIYTLTTIYAEADLEYLKFTQSADVMSICCVNQQTFTEYPPLDLTRSADDNWAFNIVVPAPTVLPPPSCSVTASTGTGVDYAYVVTSTSPSDGSESTASPIGAIANAVDIASTAGSLTITWGASPTSGVDIYNVYKATPCVGSVVPAGALYGFAGQAYGTQFIDSNIVADFTQVPPTHQNPFAPGQILGATVTNGGSGSSFAITINTLTGSGAVLVPVIISNVLVAIIAQEPGGNYAETDTVSITNGATATLQVGAESGVNPSVVAYFQERRGYGSSLNNPDTYWFSQPGAYTNFDFRNPTIDSDSITGTPWAVEVNGIQFMLPMPGGLLVLTGLGAWLLSGNGSGGLSAQPLTPASQDAQPQAYNGCSQTVGPIKVDYDVIYLQAKGSIYRRFNFNLYANIYTGEDITINSSQLFTGYTIREHAWTEEPYKVLWTVRSDGVLLSATINKPQEVLGWARHDTNGLFQSVCSITEPPVDALYVAVQRFPGANTCYMIERMDDRIWAAAEDSWCVDAALTLPQPTPNATLTASSAMGLGACSGVTNLVGGANWSTSTQASVFDLGEFNQGGPGTGAVPALAIVGGVITAVTFGPGNQGQNYQNPAIALFDPQNTGSGASATITLNNTLTFTASLPVFSIGNVGNVIRMGGGIAVITAFTDSEHVTANMLSPIVDLVPMGGQPVSAAPGDWSMTAPVTTISGLNHLIGTRVTGLADGNVIPPTVVPSTGTIALPAPTSSNVTGATAVTVGLGFQAQLQTMYLDTGEPTVQGQRKKIAAATVRMEASRGLKMGSNQPDGAALSPPQLAPAWSGLDHVPETGQDQVNAPQNALCVPLRTADVRIPVKGGYRKGGQVCLQQDNPLPMSITGLIPEYMPGDTPQLKQATKADKGKVAA